MRRGRPSAALAVTVAVLPRSPVSAVVGSWGAATLEEITETDRPLRIANQARLRELLRVGCARRGVPDGYDRTRFPAHRRRPDDGPDRGGHRGIPRARQRGT